MAEAVRSHRIERGLYRRDTTRGAVIRSGDDLRKKSEAFEDEIRHLKDEIGRLQSEGAVRIDAARQAGYDEGYSAGLEAGRKTVEPAIQQLKQLTEAIEFGVESVWESMREGFTRATLAAARQVVGNAAENSSAVAAELTARCIKLLKEQSKVTIIINPADAAALRNARADLLKLCEGLRTIEFMERGSIAAGGVIIETDAGQLDARLEEQLAALDAKIIPDWQNGEGGR